MKKKRDDSFNNRYRYEDTKAKSDNISNMHKARLMKATDHEQALMGRLQNTMNEQKYAISALESEI